MIQSDEYTLWLTAGDAEMHARIIDAHYAQAEKADEARAGAAEVRFTLRHPTLGGDPRREERRDTQDGRRTRARRDFLAQFSKSRRQA